MLIPVLLGLGQSLLPQEGAVVPRLVPRLVPWLVAWLVAWLVPRLVAWLVAVAELGLLWRVSCRVCPTVWAGSMYPWCVSVGLPRAGAALE